MIKRLRANMSKLLVLCDQAVVSGSSFLTNIIIARALGVSGYGRFSAIILAQLFLLSLQQAASSGIYQVMFPRFGPATQKKYNNGIFYLQLFLYGVLVLAAALIYQLFPAITGSYKDVFIPAVAASILFLLQDFLRKVLITRQEEARALMIDIITNGLQIVILLVFVATQTLSLAKACWIIFATFIPSAVAGIYWIQPGTYKLKNMKLAAARNKQQSSWMFLSALLQWFAGNFFVMAAGWWLGMAALGALRLAQYIFGLLNVLLQAIENYALPAASKLQEDSRLLAKFLKKMLFTSLVTMLPALVIVVVFARQLLLLSGGADYTSYAYVMYGLTANYLLIVFGLPVRITLRAKLLSQHYFAGYVIATAFSMATARWLIGGWELRGVLVGLFFTQLIVLSYWLLILKRKKVFTWKLFTSY